MAEVIIPPEELEPELPEEQLPEVEKPTEKSKVISVDFNPLNTKQTTSLDTRESFFTTDTDAWIVLNVGDMNEPTGQYSLALINKEDGSIFQRTGDIVQGVAYYKLLPNEIKHAGRWVGQAVITLANGQTTASRFSFNVSGHILDGKDVREIVIQDFQTLMAQLNDLKDNATNEFSFLKNEFEAFQAIAQENEDERQATELGRVAAEIIREENYESKVTAAIVEADVVEKVDNKVAELAPTIQQVTAQLAQTETNKVDKNGSGQVLYSNLSQEVRQMFTGDKVAVVGDNSIITSNLTKNAVTEEKTSFISISPNLFDKEKIQIATLFTGSGASMYDFTKTNNNAERASGVIKVEPATSYKTSGKTTASGATVVSFDSNGNYLRGLTGVANADGTYNVNTMANTAYIGFNYSAFELNEETFMLAKASEYPNSYVPFGKTLDHSLIKDTINRVGVLESVTNTSDNPIHYDGEEVSVFDYIVCCGDSLTRGTFNSSTVGFENSKYSYPTYLTKLTGVKTENLGNPSFTTKQWYENRSGRDFSLYDSAIIQLGVNDASQGVSDEETTHYLQLIVDKLKTDQPKMKIFIATITGSKWYDAENYRAKSEVIKAFASGKEAENIFCIDLKKYSDIYDLPYASGHLTALGYLKQAKEYKNYISYIIKNNPDKFDDVQFMGTDYLAYV